MRGVRRCSEASRRTFSDWYEALAGNVGAVVHGKDDVVELALVCVFAQGHLLVEDVPGVGKTTLAKALARSIDGSFGRIQFTPDLLPSDVVGVSVWNRGTGDFVFRPGPVFSNVVVADEVNRAIMNRARQFPGQEQQVFQYYAQNPQAQAEIRAPLFEDKVVDFIAELAQVTEKTVDRETLFADPEDE